MQKLLILLTLAGMATEPLQSMYAHKARMRTAQASQPQINISPETAVIGSALAIGAGLCYWLYRSNYKSSLKEACESLESENAALANFETHPLAQTFDKINCREAAKPLYREITSKVTRTGTIVRETKKHKDAWRGYNDYPHAKAAALIRAAENYHDGLKAYEEQLDYHVARFVFSAETVAAIAPIAERYSSLYNPLAKITNLDEALAFQRQLTEDEATMKTYRTDLIHYMDKYLKHPDYQVALVLHKMDDADQITKNIAALKPNLQQVIESFKLEQQYCEVDGRFRYQLSLSMHDAKQLVAEISFTHRKETFPLLACICEAELACASLQSQMKKIAGASDKKEHAQALIDELQSLIKTIVALPEYSKEKELHQDAQEREQERAQKARQATLDRETKERIARQDREAKERHDKEMAEQQRRIARAKEQEAIAAREKADAEQRKARAEEERVRIERERLRLEREKLNASQKPATNITINVKKQTNNKDDLI